MSSLSALASSVSLADEISRPTEIKEAVSAIKETVSVVSESFEHDFEIPSEPVNEIPTMRVVEDEPFEEEYDAEKNARALVNTLVGIDQFILNIAVIARSRASVGGSKAIERMKKAMTKEVMGEELTEMDKRLIARMKEYKSNMEMLSGKMMIRPEFKDQLIQAATDYCRETQFKIGSGTAFWANYVSSFAERVTQIIVM